MEKQQKIATFLNMLNTSGELEVLYNKLMQKLASEPRSPSIGMFMPYSTGSILVRSTRVLQDAATQRISDCILMHLYGMSTIDGERWCNLIARSGRPGDMATVLGAHLASKFNDSLREEENEDAMGILHEMRNGLEEEDEEDEEEEENDEVNGEDDGEEEGESREEEENNEVQEEVNGEEEGESREEEEGGEVEEDKEDEEEEMEDEMDEVERNGLQQKGSKQGKKKRIRRQCVLCGRGQNYLSIHLKRVHKIPTDRRHKMLYDARITTPVSKIGLAGPTPCRRRLRDCPVQGCPAKGLKRVDGHLAAVHHLTKKSQEYQLLLMKASGDGKTADVPPSSAPSASPARLEHPSKPCDEQDTCLGQFQKYLGVRGGSTTAAEKSAQQHRRQVESLLTRLHLASMRQLVTPSIPMRIVESLRKGGFQPKTISSYLLSVKKLCRYLQTYRQTASCLGISNQILLSTTGCVDDFAASLRPSTVRRELELKAHIADILIPEGDVKKFKKAAVAELEATIRALQSSPDTVEWSRMARLRNIIITLILLSSGHRSGVITQLCLDEFCDAREVLIGALEPYFVVKVKNHKTSGTYGPVHIALTEEQYRWCRAYMDLARPRTPGAPINNDPAAPFFLGRGGAAVDRVAQEVSRLGLTFGVNNITPVNIRKTIASKVFRTQSAQTRARIAEHMAHQEATQAHYYKASNNTSEACMATVEITRLLDGSCANSASPAPASSTARDLPGPSGLQANQSNTPPPLFDQDDDDDRDDEEDQDDTDYVPPSSPVQSDRKSKRFTLQKRVRAEFTFGEMKRIMALYDVKKKNFSKKENIKNIVKAIFEENDWLHKWTLQQLYDKIRHTLND